MKPKYSNHQMSIQDVSYSKMLFSNDEGKIFKREMPLKIPKQPVVVTKIRPLTAASSNVVTSKPSIAACNAFIGSTAVTKTRAPNPLRA
jgi:hypothetical protein